MYQILNFLERVMYLRLCIWLFRFSDRDDNDILVDIHTAAGWTNNTKRHKKLLSK